MKILLAITFTIISISLFAQDAKTTSCDITVPNTITMDSVSGKYLFLQKVSCEMDKFQMIIYNQWGSKLYSSSDQTEYWDASEMPAGSYMWTIYADCPKHGERSMNGMVEVAR